MGIGMGLDRASGWERESRHRLIPSDDPHNQAGRVAEHVSWGGGSSRWSGVGGYGADLHLIIASAMMRQLGYILAGVAAVGLLAAVPVLILAAYRDYQDRPDFSAFYSAATFVLVTVVMSLNQIYRHLTNWYMPDVQKYVVRIVWMVPLYAMQSWLSLRFHSARIYIDTLRDLYEALVIQSFVYYLIELLGGETELIAILQGKEDHYGEHQSVFAYFFKRWDMGIEFLVQCRYGVLQYVVIKTISALLTAVLEPLDLYGEGIFDLRRGYTYISFAINVSQMWALYCLIKLFHATSEELRHPKNWQPLGKFLCVKGVVFFTWWQSLGIFFLRSHGIIDDLGSWSGDDVANGLQDYLVCVEMFFFAVAHSFTFTHLEYMPSEEELARGREWYGDPLFDDDGDGDSEGNVYRPLTSRTLQTPMDIRDAFWSSTVPNETLEDIKRLRHGVSDEVKELANEPGMISMESIQRYAESI